MTHRSVIKSSWFPSQRDVTLVPDPAFHVPSACAGIKHRHLQFCFPVRFSSSRLSQAIVVLMSSATSFICSDALNGKAEYNGHPYQATACTSQKAKCTWKLFCYAMSFSAL